MANLYADENLKYAVVEHLRLLGHDVLTVQEAGQQGGDDAHVLAFATAVGRAVLTFNRRHFVRLHARVSPHRGILVCTDDEAAGLAARIHQALAASPLLDNQLVRIDRLP